MKRQKNVPFSAAAASGFKPQPPGRVPQPFLEAMKRVSAADPSNVTSAAKSQPAQKGQSAQRWKSSFKPLDGEDGNPEEKSTSGTEKTEPYDPYHPLSSDSEPELPQAEDRNHSPPNQDKKLERQRVSSGRGGRDTRQWDSSYSEPRSPPVERCEFNSGTKPTEIRGLSPGNRLPERRTYSPSTKSPDRPGYVSKAGPLDQRGCSPDRLIHGSSSSQRFPAPYGGQRTNGEERIPLPEYRREQMTTTVRLSPPRLQRDYQHQPAYVEKVLDQDPPPTKVTQNKSRTVLTERGLIACDLCDIEVANGKELEDHLDSKCHWDTLEHIQQNNTYDDLAIAFLQEVMLYKSHKCSRAIEDSALQALQENDHMTKVEMFHCAACKVFVSTSAEEVQTHITSLKHLHNTKEFEVQQRHACLSKAETMMRELKPQFEDFLKGGSPFE